MIFVIRLVRISALQHRRKVLFVFCSRTFFNLSRQLAAMPSIYFVPIAGWELVLETLSARTFSAFEAKDLRLLVQGYSAHLWKFGLFHSISEISATFMSKWSMRTMRALIFLTWIYFGIQQHWRLGLSYYKDWGVPTYFPNPPPKLWAPAFADEPLKPPPPNGPPNPPPKLCDDAAANKRN